MSKHMQASYVVQVSNDFAADGWVTHTKTRSRKKAIEVADAIAKSGELARVRRIDADG